MTVHPTHKCFDDAFEFIELLVKAHPDKIGDIKANLLIVHAICLMPDGRKYSHAWVEDIQENQCIFRGIIAGKSEWLSAPLPEYHAELKVHEFTRYTLKEACKKNLLTMTYGPWEEKYKQLTRNAQRKTKNHKKHLGRQA